MNDSFSEFLSQSGILNLIISVIVLGMVWMVLFMWTLRRANERRRRRRTGEPPLPGVFVQLVNLIRGLSSVEPVQADAYNDIPAPSMADLTSGLPEPDFNTFPTPQSNATAEESDAEPENYFPIALPQTDELVSQLVEDDAAETAPALPPTPVTPVVITANEAIAVEESALAIVAEPNRNTSGVYVSGSNTIPEDAVEVLRVWRDLNNGELIMQVGSHVFQTLPELQNKGYAQRYINIVEELARVAYAGAMASGIAPPDFNKNSALFSQQGAWAKPKAKPVPVAKDAKEDVEHQLMQAAASAGSIAEQIEELLQMRLSQTPGFSTRSIHVRPASGGSLRIEVDGMYYEHVDEIIDPDVREYIRNVIKEWEARQ